MVDLLAENTSSRKTTFILTRGGDEHPLNLTELNADYIDLQIRGTKGERHKLRAVLSGEKNEFFLVDKLGQKTPIELGSTLLEVGKPIQITQKGTNVAPGNLSLTLREANITITHKAP